MRVSRSLVAVLLAAACHAPVAHAQRLIVPFVGTTFNAQTNLFLGVSTPTPTTPLARRTGIGIAGMWLNPGLLGLEAELTHAPRFFEREGESTFVSTSATTVTGSLVVTAPLRVTREALRPYAVAGLGWLHAGRSDVVNLGTVDRDLLAMNLGGGAIGMLNERAGVRFDLRHVRSVREDQVPREGFLSSLAPRPPVRLSYWRATIGVTIRY